MDVLFIDCLLVTDNFFWKQKKVYLHIMHEFGSYKVSKEIKIYMSYNNNSNWKPRTPVRETKEIIYILLFYNNTSIPSIKKDHR